MKDHTITSAGIDVTKGRSDAFDAAARELGGFIDELDLNADARNELVALACEQVSVAERDAFLFGFDMAIKLMHDHHNGEEE